MTAPFGEVVTAMVTPFFDNGEINYEAAATLAIYLAENGSDAIVVSGTTGESPTLSDEEKVRLFSTVVAAVRGKAKVIAGTGSNATNHTLTLTKQAEKCSVDGILLVVPYYNKPTQEGLFRHFAQIAANTTLPIMLYNVPGRTAINLNAETSLRLATQFQNIVAIKEASGNLEQITNICSGAPAHFSVYSGDDSLTLPILAVGGCGIVSVASHIAGKEIKAMVSAYSSGNTLEAAQIHQRLFPLFKVLFITSNPSPVKGALQMLGHQVGPLRLPLVELTEKETNEIWNVLRDLEFL